MNEQGMISSIESNTLINDGSTAGPSSHDRSILPTERRHIFERRSSETAVNDKKTHSPSVTKSRRKKPLPEQPRDLYQRSLSSSSLRLSSHHDRLEDAPPKSTMNNNTASTRSSSIPPPHDDYEGSVDGFGPIVQHHHKPVSKMGSKRRNRNVEPAERLSPHGDFLPVDPMFGDFAPTASPAGFQDRRPAAALLSESRDREQALQKLQSSMPRLWESTGEGGGHGEETSLSERGQNETQSRKKGISKSKTMSQINSTEEASPKTSPDWRKKKLNRRQSLPAVSNIVETDDDEPAMLHSSMSSLNHSQLGNDSVHSPHTLKNTLESATDHSPTFTVATLGATTVTTAYSTSRRSNSGTVPDTDDLFLIAMENFREKSASKWESKDKIKQKKEKPKKKKKRRSLPGDTTAEFNVDDQSDFFGLANTDEKATKNLSASPLHGSQPLEIPWNPPAFVLEEERKRRRNSTGTPTCWEEYEPIIPSFVYDKTRRLKLPMAHAASAFIMPPPFGATSKNDPDLFRTASAVDALLNPGAATVMGGFVDRGRMFSVEEVREMIENNNKMSNSGRSKDRRATGQTRSSSRKALSGELDGSNTSTTKASRKSGQQGSNARRRGSTSMLEMSSTPTRPVDTSKTTRRREGSTPPTSSRGDTLQSMSRSTSPVPRTRTDNDPTASDRTASNRSRKKSTSNRGGKVLQSDPRAPMPSSTRGDQLQKREKVSSRRRAASASATVRRSRSPHTRSESSERQRSSNPKSLVENSVKRSDAKPGNRKSSSSRPSSLPEGEKKSRTKSRRETGPQALQESHSTVSSGKGRKKQSRSKSIQHIRGTGTGSRQVLSSKESASTKTQTRRVSLNSAEAGLYTLDSHIVKPRLLSEASPQSSWAAATLSTEDDKGVEGYVAPNGFERFD